MAKKEKAPAFQFYVDEWLASNKRQSLTLSQTGAFINLMARAWKEDDCSIPDCDKTLARWSEFHQDWFIDDNATAVRNMFTKVGDKLILERLVLEKEKQKKYRKLQSEKGKASAKKRAKIRKDNALSGGNRGYSAVKNKSQPKSNPLSITTSLSLDNNIYRDRAVHSNGDVCKTHKEAMLVEFINRLDKFVDRDNDYYDWHVWGINKLMDFHQLDYLMGVFDDIEMRTDKAQCRAKDLTYLDRPDLEFGKKIKLQCQKLNIKMAPITLGRG